MLSAMVPESARHFKSHEGRVGASRESCILSCDACQARLNAEERAYGASDVLSPAKIDA